MHGADGRAPELRGDCPGLVVLALLLGGVAVYLLGHAAIRYRHVRTLNRRRTALAVALPAAVPLTPEVPSLVPLAATVALLAAVIVYETHRYGEGRARVRHSFETARH